MGNIVHLSEAASIAIHSLVLIAKSENQVNVQSIADKTGSSRHHVAKVLQRLTKDGFIASSRGPHGGFQLKKSANEISLLEIYEAIEGAINIPKCAADHHVCPFNKCLMDDVAQQMTIQFKNYLQGQTVQSYLE
ncbi:MAG: Rrf2 family transcriptional regulator [Bacteroidales bacterium]|nr:Rrf2 family transcriptional regulator [Bacteroidales bacterium]MCF8456906.1 Rrf2 family transcriptional regulator [Bacteroidales bacterium]